MVLEMLMSLGGWIAVAGIAAVCFFFGISAFSDSEPEHPEWERCRDLCGRR